MRDEKKIEELKRLVRDYETIIEIHTSTKMLTNSKAYNDYIDSILDEIIELKKMIKKLDKK